MKYEHNDGGRAAAGFRISKNGSGDCVVRSVAIATGIPYRQVWEDIKALGERERLSKHRKTKSHPDKGVWKPTIRRYMDSLGWTWTPTMSIGTGTTHHLRSGELPAGRLVVSVSKHTVAVIDGVIHDTYDCSRDGDRCVYGYFSAPSGWTYSGVSAQTGTTQQGSDAMNFLELIDNTLGTDFHKPAYDPAAGRKKLLKQIELAAKQHEQGVTRAPRRSWATGTNDAISFEPKIDGKAVLIGGEPINYVQKSNFQDFLKKLREAVEAGRLDDEIKAALDGETTSLPPASRSKGSKPAGASRTYGPQSSLNIGVAAKRKAKQPPTFEQIKQHYLDAGHDPAMIDIAIEARKKAEKDAAK